MFADLDAVEREVEHLLAVGYDKAGNWDLAQICGHLGKWLRFPMDGFPKAPAPIRAMLWLLRVTIGRKKLREYLTTGQMKTGTPTLKESVPAPKGDEAAAVSLFKTTLGRAKTYTGVLQPSPLFGQLTREEWVKLNLVHAAHHLSFLVPKSSH